MAQQDFWKETLWPDVDNIGFQGTSGIILPSGPTNERPVPAKAGHIRFNTDTNKSEIFDGFIWKGIGGGAGGGASSFTGLTDTPGSFAGAANRVVSVNSVETGLEFTTISSGATTFTSLTDTPGSFAGAANRVVSVNGSETGLEFTTISSGATTFTSLTDTPNSLAGADNLFVKVYSGGTDLHFNSASFLELSDTPIAFGQPGDQLRIANDGDLEFFTPAASGGGGLQMITYDSRVSSGGSGPSDTHRITHNFGTKSIIVQVYEGIFSETQIAQMSHPDYRTTGTPTPDLQNMRKIITLSDNEIQVEFWGSTDIRVFIIGGPTATSVAPASSIEPYGYSAFVTAPLF